MTKFLGRKAMVYIMQEVCDYLEKIFGKDNFFQNEPLKNYTSFKIGGNAKYFVSPQ